VCRYVYVYMCVCACVYKHSQGTCCIMHLECNTVSPCFSIFCLLEYNSMCLVCVLRRKIKPACVSDPVSPHLFSFNPSLTFSIPMGFNTLNPHPHFNTQANLTAFYYTALCFPIPLRSSA